MKLQTAVFDVETDGLIPEMTRIHSLVIKEVETGTIWSCFDKMGSKHSIAFGLKLLEEAETIVGHNIQEFDIPAIQKLHPWFLPRGIVRDTLILSRLIWADLTDADFRRSDMQKRRGLKWIEPFMFGRHSLQAWGQRLGKWKGDYGEIKKAAGKALGLEGADLVAFVWGTWSQDMQDYCVQDVEVTAEFWARCLGKGFSEESWNLEHDVRRIISRQEKYGFAFDEAGAAVLYSTLAQAKADLERELALVFKPWYRNKGQRSSQFDRTMVQKQHPILGYEVDKKGAFKITKKTGEKKPIYVQCQWGAGDLYTDVKLMPFNPGSRDDIADRLKLLYGWQPSEFTKDGSPKVDDETLQALPWPEAKLLTRYLMVQKRIGQLSDGKEGWLRHVRNGRIHGRISTNGAVTGRMTHSKPNIGQVPGIHDKKTGALMPYGRECRELFIVIKGKVLVGCDADALELRDLAGYMARYDAGAYIKTVLEGNKADGTDMHTLNAAALGCTREQAKTWFYAFIYGSGDANLGAILGAHSSKQMSVGKTSRAKFLAALPALNDLIKAVKKKCLQTKQLKGLDGRILSVRSPHSALNTLLQSAGAIQMKRALVILDNNLQALGLVPGVHYEFVANVHDEWQIEVDEDKAELVGKTAAEAIRLAGEYYNFRCPLAGNSSFGQNWAETH
ncbi:DNA polymerase [Mesorhizobium sp. M7A.F.Ca.CA.004.02.1.1]|uniref:DNA polymerase n=1 Tax=Mesorhizobium sp. M7A.F.Ca.CA.004.02.1.1 TaxID=2496690 RepID=UPI000FC9B026|nr:DNA polymerase [Mesorhizobium sp. M7A.F.Ca.CA.004.02.1.1]RVB02850.1 DNA polymerase [Mesorhizobium sp. M7A.F.Ca.CA.004.02.1.1]